jgi:hypothetical protein
MANDRLLCQNLRRIKEDLIMHLTVAAPHRNFVDGETRQSDGFIHVNMTSAAFWTYAY